MNILSDTTEQAEIRYVTISTDTRRYDLAILSGGKLDDQNEVIIFDLHSSRFTKINKNKIEDSEYLAHAFNVNEYESDEIYEFLKDVLE